MINPYLSLLEDETEMISSNALQLVPSTLDPETRTELEKQIDFERILEDPKSNLIHQIADLIPQVRPIYAQQYIIQIAKGHPFDFPIKSGLLYPIDKDNEEIKNCSFLLYLHRKGIILNQIEGSLSFNPDNPFQSSPMGRSIFEDNVEGYRRELEKGSGYGLYFGEFAFPDPVDFVLFWGSENILRFILLNNTYFAGDLKNLVINGSIPLIRLMESNGYSFGNYLCTAMQYHHNELAKMILENYNPTSQPKEMKEFLNKSINTEMIIYLLEKRRDLLPWNWDKCIISFSAQDNIALIEYAIEKGASPTVSDMGRNIFNVGHSDDLYEAVHVNIFQMCYLNTKTCLFKFLKLLAYVFAGLGILLIIFVYLITEFGNKRH